MLRDPGHHLRVTCPSPDDLDSFGRILGAHVRPGDVLGLVGTLGAGKTQLVRAMARGMGYPDAMPVTSPTFTLMNLYHAPPLPALCHVDVYRLDDVDELEAIGLRDFLDDGRTVIAIEWFDRIVEDFAVPHLRVDLTIGEGGWGRTISLEAFGPRAEALADGLSDALDDAE